MPAAELPPADQVQEFLGYVKDGSGPETAAYALDWTPRQLKKLMSDEAFQRDLQQILEMKNEAIEETIYRLAMRGNTRMLELWVFNRVPERWAPATQKIKIDKTTHHSVELVGSAVEAVRQAIGQQGAIAAIHAGALEASVHDDDE